MPWDPVDRIRGTDGANGLQGIPGSAATVAVGTVATGAAGSQAAVTNRGTANAAILDFTIPKGDTGAAGSGGVPTTIATVGGIECFRQTADLTNATTNNANLPGLVFNFVANAVYVIDLFLMATSGAATTGYGFNFDVSAAVNFGGLFFEHALATAGTTTGGDAIADAASRGLSSGVPAITVVNMIAGKGILVTSANPGTCQLTFRPEVAATATCKANSVMRVQRVS